MKTLRTSIVVLVLLLAALMPVLASGIKEVTPAEETATAVAVEAAPVVEETTAAAVTIPAYATVDKEDLYSAFSFAYGYYITGQLVDQGVSLNGAYYLKGLLDGYQYGTKDALMALEDMEPAVQEYISDYYYAGLSEEPGALLSLEELDALAAPEALIERFSYAYAYMNMVQLYLYNGLDILDKEFVYGSAYAMYYVDPEFTNYEEMQTAINTYAEMLDAEYAEYLASVAEYNLNMANEFLEANKGVEGIKSINDYVQVQTMTEGAEDAAMPTAEQTVIVNYALYLIDGTLADSGEEVTFPLTSLIPGFVEGVTNMKVGEEALIYIHPEHGYGAQDLGTIGPNSLLIFDVKLISIVE